MALIDENFLAEVGLAEMPATEKSAFIEQATEELEVRVGQRIGSELSSEQLAEFEAVDGTDAVAPWLEQNVPNFREIVLQVFQEFKQELLAEHQAILA